MGAGVCEPQDSRKGTASFVIRLRDAKDRNESAAERHCGSSAFSETLVSPAARGVAGVRTVPNCTENARKRVPASLVKCGHPS